MKVRFDIDGGSGYANTITDISVEIHDVSEGEDHEAIYGDSVYINIEGHLDWMNENQKELM